MLAMKPEILPRMEAVLAQAGAGPVVQALREACRRTRLASGLDRCLPRPGLAAKPSRF